MYQKQYYGIVVFKKFFGIKAGRSVWKQCTLKLRAYYTIDQAYSELHYFIDVVLPATGAKLVSYYFESELTDLMDSACNGCNAPKQCCPCK